MQTVKLIIQQIINCLGNVVMVERYAEPNWDCQFGDAIQSVKEKTLEEILNDISESPYGSDIITDIPNPPTMEHIKSAWYETMEGYDLFPQSLLTLEKDKAEQAEIKRMELERHAKAFAHRLNVGFDSLFFLSILEKEIQDAEYDSERWNDSECKMERMMECTFMHGSVYGSEIYHSDNDFENSRINSRINHLYDIRDWVASNCPMLWMKYQEGKMQEENEKRNIVSE